LGGYTSLLDTPPESEPASPAASSSSLDGVKSPSQPVSRLHEQSPYSDNPYTPYSDDPEAAEPSSHELLQSQRHMMDEQDMRLDQLAHSIGRQRDLSLQINDELDVHHGLLQEMDEDLDRTSNRMSQARRSLERVAKGAKENSTLCL
jgi:syntaxin 8